MCSVPLLAGFALRDRNLRGAAAASNPSSQPPTKPDRIVFSRVVINDAMAALCLRGKNCRADAKTGYFG